MSTESKNHPGLKELRINWVVAVPAALYKL